MKEEPLPFVGTHVANLALNKEVGLVLLFSEPQETHGLTAISEESFLNDQLQIARWMILHFVRPRGDERVSEPWRDVPEWRVKAHEMPDPTELASFEETLEQMRNEARVLEGGLWNLENKDARSFLLRLAAQINECVCYTNRRLAAIKVCARLGRLDDDPDPDAFEEELMTLGPKFAREMVEQLSMGMGMLGVVTAGYLGIKNSVPTLRIFAGHLLRFVRELLVSEARKRGYTSPVRDGEE